MIRKILEPSIILCGFISEDEAACLADEIEVAELAVSQFSRGEIDLSSFFEILEMCPNLNIDDYLNQIEENLYQLGVF
jgi:hypothetical protein